MSTRRAAFTPRFVVSRGVSGRLRSLSVPITDREWPRAVEQAPDVLTRSDVVIRQLPDDTWELQDGCAEPLSAITFEDVRDARQHAERLAENRSGAVWLRSDRPPRFERR